MKKLKALIFSRPMALVLVVGVIGLVFLYCYNPQNIRHFPRCPFLVLTGYRCPGCGTLRGIHALLHFRFLDAWRLNPLLIVSIPTLAGLIVSRRFALNVTVGRCIAVVTIVYWIVRNIFGF